MLAQGERSVDDLARETVLSLANASAHLQVLHRAHFVVNRKEGLCVYYRLADPAVVQLWVALRTAGERQFAEIDRLVATYLQGRQGLEAVSRGQLRRRLSDGATVVLDARPAVEYR